MTKTMLEIFPKEEIYPLNRCLSIRLNMSKICAVVLDFIIKNTTIINKKNAGFCFFKIITFDIHIATSLYKKYDIMYTRVNDDKYFYEKTISIKNINR